MQILLFLDNFNQAQELKEFFGQNRIECDIALSMQDTLAKIMLFNYQVVVLDFDLASNNVNIVDEVRANIRKIKIVIYGREIDDKKERFFYLLGASLVKQYPKSSEDMKDEIISLLKISPNIDIYKYQDLILDKTTRRVLRGRKQIQLKNKEFNLLEFLMRNAEKVLSRDQILDNVWDRQANIFTNTVDVHIHVLRKKIDSGFNIKLIKTIPCIGYKLEGN